MNHLLPTICLVTASLVAAASAPPMVVPVDGDAFRARLTAVDAQWNLQFDGGGKPRAFGAADLVCWGDCVEAVRGPIVVTADGGLLVADVLEADKESLTADSLLLGTLKLPLESLGGVVFDPPAQRRRRDLLLDRVARAAGQSDRIILRNGDELTGLVLGLADGKLELETDVGPIEIETDRIAAMIFNPALRQHPPLGGLRAWVGLGDGSLVLARRLVMTEKSAKITGAGGATWTTGPEQIVWLMPLGPRVTYLSDLDAAEYRHVPYLSLDWPYLRDRNVTGGRLRAGGRLYQKGLGMHSAGRLSYVLDRPYRRFQAELAIDDSTGGRGSIRARVYVDGRQKYASETIRGGQPPVPVSVDLDGAKRLDLIIDFADRADVLDHADWLGARLVE